MKMKNKKLIFCIFALIVLTILFSQSVFSLGITPSRRSVDYNEYIEVVYDVYNNDDKDLMVDISFEGELAEYANSIKQLKLDSSEKQKSFKVILAPPKLSSGIHTLEILIRDKSSTDGMVGVKTAVKGILEVKVASSGKHLDYTLNVARNGESSLIVIPIINDGSEIIEGIYADIDIYDVDGLLISKKTTSQVSLAPKTKTDLKVVVNDIDPGEYNIFSTLYYDGFTSLMNESLFHGTKDILIKKIDVKNYPDYLAFEVMIENQWNGYLEEIYAEGDINSDNGIILETIKSSSMTLGPKKDGFFNLYLPKGKIIPGNYYMDLYIRNDDFEKQITVSVDLLENGAKTNYTGRNLDFKNENLIIILILLIIVINLLFAVINMYKKSNKNK